MSFHLRDYQQESIEATSAAFRRGVRRAFISLPTGCGKTVVFAEIMRKYAEANQRVLLLAHRDELLQQAKDKLCNTAPDLCDKIGFVKGSEDDFDKPIVIASVQTLGRTNRIQRLVDSGITFKLIVTDEGHHSAAAGYQRIYEALGALTDSGPRMIGVSATPQRADGKDLGETWEEIVYHRDILSMIHQRYLVDLIGRRVQLQDLDLSQLSSRGGDYSAEEAGELLHDADAPRHTVTAWIAEMKKDGRQRKTIVFTPTIALAQEMADEFQANGISSENISGIDLLDRRDVLARFHSGETTVVCNAMILTEGFDEPSVECIAIARPTKSKVLFMQMVGRGTRTFTDPVTGYKKHNCLIMDMAGATERLDLVTLPRLVGLGVKEGTNLSEKEIQEGIEIYGLAGMMDKLNKEGRLIATQVNLFNTGDLNWQMTKPGLWTLNCAEDGMYVVTIGKDNRWSVQRIWYEKIEGTENKVEKWEELGSNLGLDYAMGMVEDKARRSNSMKLISKDAPWRMKPASEDQLKALRKLHYKPHEGITRGEASDLMDAYWAKKKIRKVAS